MLSIICADWAIDSDRPDDVTEIIQMFIPMLIHGLYAMAEHNQLDAATSQAPNAPIVTMIFFQTLSRDIPDLEIKGIEEIIRVADELSIELRIEEPIRLKEDDLEAFRQE